MSGRLFGRISLFNLRNRRISPKTGEDYCIRPVTVTNCLNLNSHRSFSVSNCKNMKLLQYSCKCGPKCVPAQNRTRVGYLVEDKIVDIHEADPSLSRTTLEILQNDQLEKVKQLCCRDVTDLPTVSLSEVNILAPVTGMDKVLCIGLNYKDHCEEQKLTPPPVPISSPAPWWGPASPSRSGRRLLRRWTGRWSWWW